MSWLLLGIPVGVVLLYYCSDWVVAGAKSLALRLGVRPFVVGITVVAFGVCIPETATSLLSGSNPDIIAGDIVGSNIANVGLVVGISAVIAAVPCKFSSVRFEALFMLAAVCVAAGLSLGGFLGWPQGIILICMLLFFIVYEFRHPGDVPDEEKEISRDDTMSAWKCLVMIAVGIAGVYIGARLFIKGAVDLAGIIGVSDQFIGLVVIALGGALPEMFVSCMAAFRGETEISLSNILGSITFNTLLALPMGAIFVGAPISDTMLYFHMPFMIAMCVLLVLTVRYKGCITKRIGSAYVLLYFVYLALMVAEPGLTQGIV